MLVFRAQPAVVLQQIRFQHVAQIGRNVALYVVGGDLDIDDGAMEMRGGRHLAQERDLLLGRPEALRES